MRGKHKRKQQKAAHRTRARAEIKRAERKTETQQLLVHTKPPMRPTRQGMLRARYFRWFLAVMTTVGGLYVVYDVVHPKIHISCSGSLDAKDPFEAVFSITNSSLLTISDVEVRCSINDVRTSTYVEIKGIDVQNIRTDRFDKISPDETATVPCSYKGRIEGTAQSSLVDYADITLNMEYSFPLWVTRLKRNARFIGRWGKDAMFHWVQEPT